ncbi:MAG: MotA/TolQ/ExbB proton channel family protein [Thermodesulfobacteriota bacterium]|nr:MotA/TolQ/ExbB proton channel family protein [Thermodesulfobacteriota bacterium]
MRQSVVSIILFLLTGMPVLLAPSTAPGQDMRALSIEARKARQALQEKIASEKAAAKKAAAESWTDIEQDREKLNKAIAGLEAENRRLKAAVKTLAADQQRLLEEEAALTRELDDRQGMVRELVGVIRVNAKDIDALIAGNPQTAMDDSRPRFLAALADKAKFPGMSEVRGLADALFDQIRKTGEVAVKEGTMIDRAGKAVSTNILMTGPFTAAYQNGDETGFLKYSAAGGKLYALSRLPSGRMQSQLARYMNGETDRVPMDITRGAALRQLTHALNIWQMVPRGGILIWPILAIFGVGLLIVAERSIFLWRKRLNPNSLIRRIEALAGENKWQDGARACAEYGGKPVARVLKAGLDCCHMAREEMENALQEAILREIPSMERFLSTLGMLAAIAPLLGLLGTVTGMIDTFHVITLHGTGDPRLMSGGISEALVTTMLGLSVAIPLMLAQTLLNRSVDKTIGQMEEKAVALVNIVYKTREVL